MKSLTMKNICIVSECQQILGIGGTETVSYLLKKGFKKNGCNVWSMYFIPKNGQTEEDILFPDTTAFYSEENKRFLIDTIVKNNINVILSQGCGHDDILKLCIEVKKHTDIKLVHTFHFSPLTNVKDYNDFKDRTIYDTNSRLKRFLKSIYIEVKRPLYYIIGKKRTKDRYGKYDLDNIDAFTSINKKDCKLYKSMFPKQYRKKFHTIANPIILDNTPLKNEKENIILFVGRLTFQKRLDRLMLVWKRIYKEHPTWKLIVLGSGDYSERYQTMSKDLGLNNILFLGQQPSEDYYKRSKILCMTSSDESFGMVMVEAQKFGCVPIAYNSFAAAEDIIENGYNGLLIKPFKEKEYAKALIKLMTEESYRESLVANGPAFIEKFNIEIVIKDWINLLNNL